MSEWKGWASPGFANTNSYLASGIPWVTGGSIPSGAYGTLSSQVKIEFPYVTRTITVISRASPDLFIHFASQASGPVIANRHYVSLVDSKDSISMDVRVADLYITYGGGSGPAEFEVIAELTPIPRQDMPTLTGSGITL